MLTLEKETSPVLKIASWCLLMKRPVYINEIYEHFHHELSKRNINAALMHFSHEVCHYFIVAEFDYFKRNFGGVVRNGVTLKTVQVRRIYRKDQNNISSSKLTKNNVESEWEQFIKW